MPSLCVTMASHRPQTPDGASQERAVPRAPSRSPEKRTDASPAKRSRNGGTHEGSSDETGLKGYVSTLRGRSSGGGRRRREGNDG